MITPGEEKEFLMLKKRYDLALEYEKEKYMTDTPEGQAWAEKEFAGIVNRISIIWEKMTRDRKKNLWPELEAVSECKVDQISKRLEK